jgi:hypothetical protein
LTALLQTARERLQAGQQELDLRDARAEAKSDYHTDTPTKTWAFFIGSQDTDDPDTFRVANPVHICFITAEITYPTYLTL